MKLHTDWKYIVRKSWAVRWIALAGLLSGVEVILPLFVDSMPRHVFAILSLIATCGAIWARVLVQPKDNL